LWGENHDVTMTRLDLKLETDPQRIFLGRE
jgi:hypothetical protein